MKTILAILLSVFILTACGHNPPVREVVTEIHTVVIETPANLLKPCKATAPPTPEVYLYGDVEEKESMLIDYSMSLLADIQICNFNLSEIKLYQDRQIKIVKAKNNGTK